MITELVCPARRLLLLASALLIFFSSFATAQDTVTGAFEGTVTSSQTGAPVAAAVEIVNQQTGLVIPKRTDSRGRFYQGLLQPGIYTIRVSAPGFQTKEVVQRLFITRTGEVVPVPVSLDPVPVATAAPSPSPGTAAAQSAKDTDVRATINMTDARRGGAFTEEEVSTLPLGAVTLTRTFDELTLLLPGVAPPPQETGNGAGPGVGVGVGSPGQFAVNGLRSRGNNFTVDGSDNNDEDIGVRRQGFLSLIPQSIESIKEYQAITLLAPAQFGRNIGAQVNAVSKSGGNEVHGTVYGFFNSSQLNARNFFDTNNGNGITALRSGNQSVISAPAIAFNEATLNFVPVGGVPVTVRNESGGKDSLTLGQFGFVIGGPIKRERSFYFFSAEDQVLNATKEASFEVPTVAERGVADTGATGIFHDPFNGGPTFAFPSTFGGDAIFSLFPFPNNPNGVYGENTFTQTLPAGGRGKIFSAKYDENFKFREKQQSVTARYNFTDDRRIIPVTGGAIFSSLEPRVRAQNFSFFFNSELSGPDSGVPLFNQVRLSYGRTRLRFDEVRDNTFLLPSGELPSTPFLLNARLRENFTLPNIDRVNNRIVANTGPVLYLAKSTTESLLGPVGQVIVTGFSPIGVDVFNFPQRRVNNTYQFADQLTVRSGSHSYAFGTDNRRTELNSDLARNFRPLITFQGAPELILEPNGKLAFTNKFFRPVDLAAASAASGFFQTLTAGSDAAIHLRFYQINFFGQDEWRIRPNLSLSYGLRYEYNTPPREVNKQVESSFNDPALSLVPGLQRFIAGRSGIFDPDRNNFAPRLGIAYSPKLFGHQRGTVLRTGYGLFYDQILGAVVSQSRSVFPRFLTVNLAGGIGNLFFFQDAPFCPCPLSLLNPADPRLPDGDPLAFGLVQRGTLNRLDPTSTLAAQVALVNRLASVEGDLPSASGVEITLPSRRLQMPLAHHYTFSVEQQLNANMVLSTAYVGTLGRNLIRFTTPNLGTNSVLLPDRFSVGTTGLSFDEPQFFGFAVAPGVRLTPAGDNFVGGRPESTVGGVSIFETTASSRYDALQLQVRGRFRRALQYQAAYTLSKATDDVSDVFDLAGSSALPQNSLTFAGERGPANFDARQRFTYNFVYDVPGAHTRHTAWRFLFDGLQIAGTGQFQTGPPFTVISLFDVNLDGNLTDRLNSVAGIAVTGDRRQPLRLTTNDPSSMLAPVGQDGRIGRNTFRAGNLLELDLSVNKTWALSERQSFSLRTDIFNFINRANFGIPERYLEASGFGHATDTVTPGRRIQFALKYRF